MGMEEEPRKTTWKSGMLNGEYPTRIWTKQDGTIDFGMVMIPSKTGGKGTEYNDHFEGLVYEVIVNPEPDRPGGMRLECPCPGFQYRVKCRHVELVRSELEKARDKKRAAQG